MKTISVVVPAYNEEKILARTITELVSVLDTLGPLYTYELIIVDDGSKDGTARVVLEQAEKNNRVKLLQFTRNFGKEISLTAGINTASGDAVVTTDADLQQPPELILEFVKHWEAGARVAVGVRKTHSGEKWIKRFGSYVFYKLMAYMSETAMLPYSTDFRLMDREVVESFKQLGERNRITRGLIDWLGYDTEYIYYDSKLRTDSKPVYSFLKLSRLAMISFVTHSIFPLKLVGYLGMFVTGGSLLLGAFMLLSKYVWHTAWGMMLSGVDMLSVVIVFQVGIVLCCLGFIALYIANIQSESLRRPLYIVKKKHNF